jgi:hypothetical protein
MSAATYDAPAGLQLWDASAAPETSTELKGGEYGVTVVATSYAQPVIFEKVAPDGSTAVPVLTFNANGYARAKVPPGQYQWSVADAAGVYAEVSRIPDA